MLLYYYTRKKHLNYKIFRKKCILTIIMLPGDTEVKSLILCKHRNNNSSSSGCISAPTASASLPQHSIAELRSWRRVPASST